MTRDEHLSAAERLLGQAEGRNPYNLSWEMEEPDASRAIQLAWLHIALADRAAKTYEPPDLHRPVDQTLESHQPRTGGWGL